MREVLALALLVLLLGACADQSTRYRNERLEVRDRDAIRSQQLVVEGVKLMKAGEFDQAEQVLEQALDVDPISGIAHNNLGKVFYHQDRLYEAAWQFRFAAKFLRYQPEPLNNLGLVLEMAGEIDKAVEKYEDALNLQPDNLEMLANLVRARLRRGDQGNEVDGLLVELVLKDTRPEWKQWAKSQLATKAVAVPVHDDGP